MRFAKAYLAASASALLTYIGILGLWALGAGDLQPAQLPEYLRFYAPYALVFTGILGLVGWLVLRIAGLDRPWQFGLVGFALGGLGIAPYISMASPVTLRTILIFATVGAVSALTFRWMYGPTLERVTVSTHGT